MLEFVLSSGIMEVTWQNIDKALGDLIVHEGGLMFQRLAISLAKLRWPEIIATTPHNDGGEDAFMPYYFESNGKHLSVACSITATYDKIKSDAQKIIDRGKSLDILVFYTPESKSNRKLCDDWGKKLKQELGCDLLPIPREEIIHTLLEQDDHWRCREFLSLNVPHTPDIQTIVNDVKIASQEIINQWKENLLSDTFLVELTINEKTKYHMQEINHEDIASKLSNKDRFVLYGSPGSGKTTTLIQVAQKLVDKDIVPFLLSLPEWIDSTNDNIIDYLANNPCLSSKNITTDNLLSLYKNGKCIFLLNGWNEIEPSNIKKATRLLARLNREYTAAGIILATRESSFSPPFFDESKLIIKELSNSQRRQLIQQSISEDISGQIESNRSLSQITRTPLFLIELIEIYQDSHTLPRTRVEIFERILRKIEISSEHSVNLQSPPMSGKSEYYLIWLSSCATRLGQVIIKYDDACREIDAATTQLQHNGQLQTVPEPTGIINILCDRHILVKSSYPDSTVRFVHQQFQEYYAYLYIKNLLLTIMESKEEKDIRSFQEEILNYPIWEEPLRLLVEEIAEKLAVLPDNEHALKVGEYLVRWTIPVDPVFAATLVKVLGDTIWNIVKDDFEAILRKWYECPDENHKKCALAAMFATGKDAFTDIIWPLLEHEDNQVRLKTYSTAKRLFVSSLGNNWKNRIDKWTEDLRSEFLRNLAHYGTDVINILKDYAQSDSSQKVKVTAINEIGWYYSASRLYDIISTCDEEIFKIIIEDDYILSKIPEKQIPRAIEIYLGLLKDEDNQNKRLRLLLRMYNLDKSKSISLLKKELESFQPEKRDSLINDFLKKVAGEDPEWVSRWVCQQIANGNLYYDHYSDYITKVPESLIGELLKDFVKSDYSKQLEFETKKLIAAGATQEHIYFIFQEIVKLSAIFKESTATISEPERNLYHRLIDVIRLVPLQNLAAGILEHYKKPNSIELRMVLNLLGLCKISNIQELHLGIREETQCELRNLLCEYLELVLNEDDYSGRLKADISCAIAVFGQPEDIVSIKKLVVKDIERVRNARKLRKEGIRNSPQVNGCGTSWTNWHIRAILKVHSDEIEDFLIQLLNEPEYENDAANGLAQLLWKDVPKEKLGIVFHDPLSIGSLKWREEYIDSAKRKKYAQAIVQRINDKRKKDSGCAPKTLTGHLAKLNDPDTIPLILEILDVPQQFDAWRRLNPLEILVRNGHCLDTSTLIKILGFAIEQTVGTRSGSRENNMYLLTQCLSVLVCSNDVAKAVSFIDKIITEHKLLYELRNLIETLGNRKTSEAAEYLIHLCQNKRLYNSRCYELIKALGETEAPEAKQALFSTIDNNISSPKIPMPNHNGRSSLEQASAKYLQIRHIYTRKNHFAL